MRSLARRGGVRSGPVLVLGLVAAGLLGGALTWSNYTRSNPSTGDAVLRWVGVGEGMEVGGEEEVAVEMAASGEGGEEGAAVAREEAEMELRLLGENLASAKEALEQAVVMVREAKENFDFAADRHEKLMPLVETGALEPLAASQIQSAYISARAAWASAKFLLAQAKQEYGSLEARRFRWELAAGKLRKLEGTTESTGESIAEEAETGAEEVGAEEEDFGEIVVLRSRGDGWAEGGGEIEAWFAAEAVGPLRAGMQARVSLPGGKKLGAVVAEIGSEMPSGPVRVVLRTEERPPGPEDRLWWPCQVTVDTTLPLVEPSEPGEAVP